MTHNMTIKAMTNEFIVWRAASSVNWDCTIGDLAEETGLHPVTIASILRRKGWRDRVNDDPYRHVDRLPVDHAMSNTHANILGRF
jgi:predicted transcriptional regulator of viral defense system